VTLLLPIELAIREIELLSLLHCLRGANSNSLRDVIHDEGGVGALIGSSRIVDHAAWSSVATSCIDSDVSAELDYIVAPSVIHIRIERNVSSVASHLIPLLEILLGEQPHPSRENSA
jgi:hypothetical protein